MECGHSYFVRTHSNGRHEKTHDIYVYVSISYNMRPKTIYIINLSVGFYSPHEIFFLVVSFFAAAFEVSDGFP